MGKDLRFGPIWTEDGAVEIPMPRPLSATDRAALGTGYLGAQLINRELGEVLEAVAAMRQQRRPVNPARAMAAAHEIRRMMAAFVDEVMAAGMVTDAESGHILEISKEGAKYRRKAARRAEADMPIDEWTHRYDVGLRPRGINPREWYGTEDDGPSGSTVVNISTGTTGIQSAGSVDNEDIDL